VADHTTSSNVRRSTTHRGAPAPEFLSARNLTKGQLFIGVSNAGDSQKEEVYATPVMSASGLGVQLQSVMMDKASNATWQGVFEAASVEVLTDVAEVTNCLRRGAEDLHTGLTAKKKPRFPRRAKESKLVQLPTLLVGPPGDAMIRLQGCWEDLVGNQSAAVNMSVAAGNVDKIPGVSCRIVVLCDKQRQLRFHLPGSMFQTLMDTAG